MHTRTDRSPEQNPPTRSCDTLAAGTALAVVALYVHLGSRRQQTNKSKQIYDIRALPRSFNQRYKQPQAHRQLVGKKHCEPPKSGRLQLNHTNEPKSNPENDLF